MKQLLGGTGWNESILDRLSIFFREKERIEQAHPEFKVLDITPDCSRVMVQGNGMRGWVQKELFT